MLQKLILRILVNWKCDRSQVSKFQISLAINPVDLSLIYLTFN